MQGARTGLLVATVAAAACGSGCSWLYMKRAPSSTSPSGGPVECTTSRFAPVADAVYAAANGVGAGLVLGRTSWCDRSCALGLVSASVAAVLAASAATGFHEAKRCEDLTVLNAACPGGDRAACRGEGGITSPTAPRAPTPGRPAP